MSEDTGRIAARNKAAAAQRAWRAEQATALRRRQTWALDAAMALGERDAAIARCERQAGEALARLVKDGLGLEDAVLWTGGAVTARQARSLIALVSGGGDGNDDVDGSHDDDEPSGAAAAG